MDRFLRAAIDQAKKGLAEGGLPIGSVLVRDGTIIAAGHNRRVQHGDPMAHAEHVKPDHRRKRWSEALLRRNSQADRMARPDRSCWITDDNLWRPTRRAGRHYTKNKLSTRRDAVQLGGLCSLPIAAGLRECVTMPADIRVQCLPHILITAQLVRQWLEGTVNRFVILVVE